MTAAQAWRWVAERENVHVWFTGGMWACGKTIQRGLYTEFVGATADTPLAAVRAAAKAMEGRDAR